MKPNTFFDWMNHQEVERKISPHFKCSLLSLSNFLLWHLLWEADTLLLPSKSCKVERSLKSAKLKNIASSIFLHPPNRTHAKAHKENTNITQREQTNKQIFFDIFHIFDTHFDTFKHFVCFLFLSPFEGCHFDQTLILLILWLCGVSVVLVLSLSFSFLSSLLLSSCCDSLMHWMNFGKKNKKYNFLIQIIFFSFSFLPKKAFFWVFCVCAISRRTHSLYPPRAA